MLKKKREGEEEEAVLHYHCKQRHKTHNTMVTINMIASLRLITIGGNMLALPSVSCECSILVVACRRRGRRRWRGKMTMRTIICSERDNSNPDSTTRLLSRMIDSYGIMVWSPCRRQGFANDCRCERLWWRCVLKTNYRYCTIRIWFVFYWLWWILYSFSTSGFYCHYQSLEGRTTRVVVTMMLMFE